MTVKETEENDLKQKKKIGVHSMGILIYPIKRV